MAKLTPTGGAKLHTDDNGKPYWSIWGVEWRDETGLDPGEPMKLNPGSFPPGTRIVIYEPGPDSKASRDFYANIRPATA